MQEPVPQAAPEPDLRGVRPSLVQLTHFIYGLHAIAVLIGVTSAATVAARVAMDVEAKAAKALPDSPAAQVAFNNKKGSIPIRSDIDTKAMDICAQAGVAALKDPSRHVANPDMLLTPDVNGAVQDVITKYWNSTQTADEAAKALLAAVKG